MTKYIAKELLEKYLQGTCNEEEQAIVESWQLKELEGKTFNAKAIQVESAYKSIWKGISTKAGTGKNLELKNRPYRYLAIAATILIALSAGLFFIQGKLSDNSIAAQLAKSGQDFVPGGNKATLTLADGSRISLTDAANGNLAKQAGITVTKTQDGQLVYNVDAASDGRPHLKGLTLMNTISTPRGGQYQITLPDGSKVWLNAESSLKYPIDFNAGVRKVELTGEAYFEIAKINSPSESSGRKTERVPFIVVTDKQEVEVLGTHFNISSYSDEAVTKTTLLEGSVNVLQKSSGNSRLLKPGQQSKVSASQATPIVASPDLESEMAWKNGLFIFREEPIETIIKDLSRWYDVDISFEGKPVNVSFVGIVSRSKNISSVLKILEETGDLHFKVEGRKILIMN
ncbi:transmembrane sensor [Pedobacter africanus]|uniref:Ferric-dicitrate binding protein FerR (Iron transport regulator) n=1 Tax=Pedobacter africanus TaxID=151894 RepID=A0ACC6KZ71_9SPHI|nr:FecR domain-containing protein [Pedobacter africanus]MDR6784418.1 ferric-dicitrate binding protein FerR (iron transport regulator) [Pedobacter africanus]